MGESFGAYLKKLREDRGMTLRDVEREAKISNAYLSQVENDTRRIPSIKILTKLSNVYGTNVTELIKKAEALLNAPKIKKDKEEAISNPDGDFIGRRYERLSDDAKKTLKDYLQYLEGKEKEK